MRLLLLRLLPISLIACAIFSAPPPTLTIETIQAQVTNALPSTPPTALEAGTPTQAVSPLGAPTGKIVFTCQIANASSQLCLINADGTAWRQLTSDPVKHWYASIAPDGLSIIYSAYLRDNVYEIYELTLASGQVKQITDSLGILKAPEISSDGRAIVFGLGTPNGGEQIWAMERSGSNARKIHSRGWDPSWSPDGTQILFASDYEGAIQLYVININGAGPHRITQFDALRGRSDWSPDGAWMVTYNGEAWHREVFIFRPDFSDLRQLTPTGGNSQGPSFSPDGGWVAFTSYFDHYNDDLGCEIYIIRIDGTDLRRLTDNAYCDYQPRWGP